MLTISSVVAILVFIGFMSLVGSPSEVETIIGIIFAAIAFIITFIIAWREKSKFNEKDQNSKIAELERELVLLKSKK